LPRFGKNTTTTMMMNRVRMTAKAAYPPQLEEELGVPGAGFTLSGVDETETVEGVLTEEGVRVLTVVVAS